jgi:hypothetical protein
VSDNRGALHGHRIEKRSCLGGEVFDSLAGVRLLRVAEAALVRDEDVEPFGQQRQHAAERKPGVRPAVQEEDWLALRVT